ncbi:MAG: hypothetical protein ACOCQD_02280 [archaeon]
MEQSRMLHEAIIDDVMRSFRMHQKGHEFNLFYLIGGPGGGKTSMIRYICKKFGVGFLSYTPALERLEKFGGIPETYWVEKQNGNVSFAGKFPHGEIENYELRTRWSVPQMISEINDMATKHKRVLVLLDDFHLCDENIQRIGYELFTYYSLNSCPVADNVRFVLAGNSTSAAGAKTLLTAIKNRTTILKTEPDVDFWIENFAIENGLLPAGIAFFESKQNRVYFHENESTNQQFGSPRSWTSVFRNIEDIERDGYFSDPNRKLEDDLRHLISLCQGSVSRNAANEFCTYFEFYRKVNAKGIFDSGNFNIPENPIDLFAFSYACTSEFYNRAVEELSLPTQNRKAFKIFGDIITRMNKEEHQQLCIRNINYIYKQCPSELTDDKKHTIGEKIIKDLITKGYLPTAVTEKLVSATSILQENY